MDKVFFWSHFTDLNSTVTGMLQTSFFCLFVSALVTYFFKLRFIIKEQGSSQGFLGPLTSSQKGSCIN